MSGPDRGGDYGSFDKHQITAQELVNATRDVQLEYFLQKRAWPNPEDPGVKFGAYKKVAMQQKERELGIRVSDEAVATEARQILTAINASFDQLVDGALKPQGFNASDFDRFVRGELAQRQLAEAASLNGRLVTPQEAESLYRLEHQELATDLAFFATSNFLGSVSVTPELISSFYSNSVANYRIPEQVQVSYVKFSATNYLAAAKAAATNLDQLADQALSRIGTNYLRYGKTKEEAKAAMKDEELHNNSLMDARKEAGQFADELDKGTNKSPAALEDLAKKKGLAVLTTAPFTQRDGPADLKVQDSFTTAAFARTPDDPFSGAVLAEDGVYVLAYKQRIPSRVPDLKTVETKVTADYRESQARQLAQQAAMKFDTTLTNGLAQGKTFKALADEAKVKFETLPPFSVRTESLPAEVEDKVNLNQLKQYAFTTPIGMASPAVPTRDGAFVLYVEKQLPLDEAKMKANLPAFTNTLRDSRQNEAFNEWFNAQLRADPVFIQRLQKLAMEAQMASSRPRS